MKNLPAVEKIEWAFDHQSAWKAVRVQAMGGRGFGESLPAGLLASWKQEAARWEAGLDLVRVFSSPAPEVELSFYDAASGRRSGSVPVRQIPKGRKGWPDGELGAVLEEFHRLVPLSGMWSWRTPAGAQSVFPLQEPAAWPLLLSMSLFAPLARILPTLGKAPNILITGFGFVDDRMELCFQPPRALPARALSAASAGEPAAKDRAAQG